MYSLILKTLLTSLVFLLLIVGYFHTVSAINQDLGRHIINGQIILEQLNVPKINLFSYAYSNFPFINHHWLSEVLFYLMFIHFGFNGLLVFATVIVIIAFSIIFFFVLKKDNIIAISIASALYLRVLFERTDIRPEILSFLFLSVFITMLYSYNKRFSKWILMLIPIEFLWVNTHIYFIIGIAAICLFLSDSILTHRKPIINKYTGILVVVFIGSILATLLNPNSLNGAIYPFKIFQNYGYPIEENQNIFFLWSYSQKPTIIYFTISLSLLFLTLFLTITKTKPIDWLLSIFFAIFAIISIRNFPLFVFATFIPLVNSLSIILEKLFSLCRKIPYIRNVINKGTIIVVIFLIIIWQIVQVSFAKTVGFGVEEGAKNAVDFFLKNNLKGPLFNNFDIGSYLNYRLYPKERVFVDGRPEAYPASFFQNIYIPMQKNPLVFQKISKQYSFNAIFFAHTDQTPWAGSFIKQMAHNPEWQMVYLDDYVVIFVKNNDINQEIVKKFKMGKENLKISHYNPHNLNSLLRLAHLFNIASLQKQEAKIYQHILTINPKHCLALYNLYFLLTKEDNPAAPILLTQFRYTCHK